LLGLTVVGAAALLAACGGGEDEAAAASAPAPPPPAPSPPAANRSPTITGTPAAQVMADQLYSFTPNAADADGDILTFSITNKPAWATFTTSNGRLTGTPPGSAVGTYSNIRISVTDGAASANLAAFSVEVVATATGSVTLNWTSPTQNTDGTPLSNLAGYKIYWGTSQGSYPNSVTLNNPGLATYVVDQLTPATWFFVATAINSQGVESALSGAVSKLVQ
jgi:hypothetical protein